MKIWRIGLLVVAATSFSSASALAASLVASCPPAALGAPPPAYPDLPETLLHAIWRGVVSSLIVGGLLGRALSARHVPRSRAIPATVLAAVGIVAVWSVTMAGKYPKASYSYPTQQEVTALLQVVLFPVTLLATSVSAWLAGRVPRRAP